jgi:1,2-diacylglycerol 3-alpha-glucosyltransferase
MRVGIITPMYPPIVSGTSTLVKIMEETLSRKGIEVFVATPKFPEIKYEHHVFPIKSFKIPENIVATEARIPYLYRKSVYEFFGDKDIDILHSMNTMVGARSGIKIAKKLNVPAIHTYNTYWEGCDQIDFPGRVKFFREYSRMICNQCDHVIAPSKKISTYLKIIGVTSPITQLMTIPNLNKLMPVSGKKELRKTYGIKENDFVIITFGRVSKEKGIDTALKAISPLLKKYSDIKYLIAGAGAYNEEMKVLAEKLGIKDKTIFSGKFTHQTLPELAAISDIFLFPSKSETQGLAILEAMHLELPVVSIDEETVDYILNHGVNGYKVRDTQLAKYCEKLYLDKNLRKQMSKQAKMSAEKIKDIDTAELYADLYKNIIKDFAKKNKYQNKVMTMIN